MKDICAVINVFKRIDNLKAQLVSLQKQSIEPSEYIVWANSTSATDEVEFEIYHRIKSITEELWLRDKTTIMMCNRNLGVWSRFYSAFNCNSEYVFVVDDDIIPWEYWLEKCLTECIATPWIYWSRGSLFKSLENRFDRTVITETKNRPASTIRVDISWHSRFFPRDILPYMFDQFPKDFQPRAWEELRISYRASKYWIYTYIPAMTEDKRTRWNTDPQLWLDKVANYNTQKDVYQQFYKSAVAQWFTPIEFQHG